MKRRVQDRIQKINNLYEKLAFDEDINLPVKPKILVVDNEIIRLHMIVAILLAKGFSSEKAKSISEAKKRIENNRYDIVFLNVMIQDGAGFSILEQVLDLYPETLVIVMTYVPDFRTAIKSIRKGAYDYIMKPLTIDVFHERFNTLIQEWRTRSFASQYQQYLEKIVQYLDSELRSTTGNMERVHDMTVMALGAALHLRNSETESHCRRVAEHSLQLGKSFDLSDAQMRNLKWGGYLHDIGKIGISEKILLKPGSLTPDEWKVVKTHAVMGYEMIENIDFLKGASEVVLYHHERFDGTGYPSGLVGKNIPLLARIFAVFDAFDAMVMGRPYKKPISAYKARQEIARSASTHFDTEIVEHFLGLSYRDLLAA